MAENRTFLLCVDTDPITGSRRKWPHPATLLIREIETKLAESTILADAIDPPREKMIESRKVFLVHGHDENTKQTVAAFLKTLALDVVILHQKPNQGQTIIEKFEKHSDVGFAVVLLTPDDFGGSVGESGTRNLRARQNVILELGFFIGSLGRHRVCSLYCSDVELPSDINGVIYVLCDSAGEWRSELAREISAAGIEIKMS